MGINSGRSKNYQVVIHDFGNTIPVRDVQLGLRNKNWTCYQRFLDLDTLYQPLLSENTYKLLRTVIVDAGTVGTNWAWS